MRYLSALLLLGLLWSCTPEEEPVIDYAIVTGTALNMGEDAVTVVKSSSDYNTMELTAENTFIDTIKMDLGRVVVIYMGRRDAINLYLEPGSVVNIDYDTETGIDSTGITGVDESIMAYLKAKDEVPSSMDDDYVAFYSREEADFIAGIDTVENAQLALIEASTLPESFAGYASNMVEFSKINQLNEYSDYHGYFTEKEDFKVSADFEKAVPTVDMDNDAYAKQHSGYQQMVLSEMQEMVREYPDTAMDQTLKQLAVMKTKKSPAIQAMWIKEVVNGFSVRTENLEASRDAILTEVTDAEAIEKLNEKYEKLVKLQPGMPSPTFAFMNHAGGETSLADLKGKYVYIDVWATWCGPCIGEIPHLKEVEKDFHGKNVAFVSISIDDQKDEEKWREFVVDRELGGVQLFGDNAWETKFVQDFDINGIPQFILLDTEGKIITADAPRPSDEKLREQLNALSAK